MSPNSSADSGFSLVEVLLAVFLLALLSIGVLPLLLGSVNLSATNKDLVAASSFANATLAELRDSYPDTAASSCTVIRARNGATSNDPAGTNLRSKITVGACPGSYPGVVDVTASITRPGTAGTLAELKTQLVVSQA